MAERRRPIRFVADLIEPDLQRLYRAAQREPRGPHARLLKVALNELSDIKSGGFGAHHHELEFMISYPDLSDCETTYVGGDPNQKDSHRLVWRESVPDDPREPITREMVALGERRNGAVYHIAGTRLGRPTGVPLAHLAAQREPIARSRTVPSPAPSRRQHDRFDEPTFG